MSVIGTHQRELKLETFLQIMCSGKHRHMGRKCSGVNEGHAGHPRSCFSVITKAQKQSTAVQRGKDKESHSHWVFVHGQIKVCLSLAANSFHTIFHKTVPFPTQAVHLQECLKQISKMPSFKINKTQ